MTDKFEERQAVTIISQGLKLFGILHLPLLTNEKKVPAVLFCHGFGGNKSGRHRLYVRLAEKLSQAGIASLRFDFRGCGDSEGSFSEITIERQLQDAITCTEFLFNQPAIDSSRFGIFGSSFGGAIAVLLSSKIPQTKALTTLAPFFDATPWLSIHTDKQKKGNIEFDHEQQRICFLGQPLSAECLSQFASLNLSLALQQISHLPFLLVQGQNDQTMGSYHLEQYEKERTKSKAETKILKLPISGHDFGEPKEQEILFDVATTWFRNFL